MGKKLVHVCTFQQMYVSWTVWVKSEGMVDELGA